MGFSEKNVLEKRGLRSEFRCSRISRGSRNGRFYEKIEKSLLEESFGKPDGKPDGKLDGKLDGKPFGKLDGKPFGIS